MMRSLPRVTIYTDGACDPNPGPGGWAALLRFPKGEKVISGAESRTTNNRMELTAAIKALKALSSPTRVVLYTDSQYLQRGISEWLPRWQARNWRRKGGKIANLELWKALVKETGRHQVEWRWVRGHAGNPFNQRVDRLARTALRKQWD